MEERKKYTKLDGYLEKLIGEHTSFTLENRIFNAVCLISMVVLGVFIFLNVVMLGAWLISCIFIVAFGILCYLYYLSRVHSRFGRSSTVYAVVCLVCTVANYFLNDGIEGPTILAFFISFQFIIATKPQRAYGFWFVLHILTILGLMYTEYYFPEMVSHTYTTQPERILDTWLTYITILGFIFLISVYIRNNYNLRRIEAEDKATAIAEQNWKIAVQNEQLERLNNEKNKIFSIISHDLKSPLDTIKGYLELLTEHELDKVERSDIKRELVSLTGNTSDMLVNLLTWSKAQMDGAKTNLQRINIKETLSATLEVQERLARKKDISLAHVIDDDVYIIADHDMVQLVVRNLVNNAVKFTQPGGHIMVRAYALGNDCQVMIQDNGQGIPADKQKDIFSLKTSTYGTNNEKGVGLGLALCKEFVEKQSGRLWFESKAGMGTVFYIALPLHIMQSTVAG